MFTVWDLVGGNSNLNDNAIVKVDGKTTEGGGLTVRDLKVSNLSKEVYDFLSGGEIVIESQEKFFKSATIISNF